MIKPPRRHALSTLLVALTLAGCATAAAPAPTMVTTPEQEALVAYERFWTVLSDAFASPGTRDWAPELREVATGSALDGALATVRNYASLPAHIEGAVSRAPAVDAVGAGTVRILDCVDLGNSLLVADESGEVLDDLANRVPRYRFRAEVVSTDGAWLVTSAEPRTDEPC